MSNSKLTRSFTEALRTRLAALEEKDFVSTVSDLVTVARANELVQKFSAQKTSSNSIPTPSAPATSDQAAVTSISGNQFNNEVEKHLTDYRRGQANLSKQTAGKLQVADQKNAELLQNIDPKALNDYGTYGSFLSYEKRARYVSNVYNAAKNITDLKRIFGKA